MRILIVDDDEVLAHMLGEQLRRLEKGFDVVAVNSAAQARLAVKEAASPFAAFVLDQRLEGSDVNGVVLMGQLRDLSPESDAIILTGYNEVEAGIAAFDLGAYRYLTKPFDTRELVYVLKSIEKSRGIRNERNWLQILTEVTTAMQSASTVQAVADAIVQGALHFDFKRARLRLLVEQGQEAQGDPEMVGVSQAGTARLKGFAGLRAPLKELMYSKQAIEAGKPMIFKAREAGKGGTDEFYAAQGMQPPVGEWVKIPLSSGNHKVGTLTLDNDELDSAFSAQQRNQIGAVLALFGNQAAAALERARLHEQTQEQAREAELLSTIGRQIITKAATSNLDELLDEIRRLVGKRVKLDVSNFMVVLSDLETGYLDYRRHYEDNVLQDRHWHKPGSAVSGYLISKNQSLLFHDAIKFCQDNGIDHFGRPAACWLGVPLRLDSGKVIGVLAVQSYDEKISYTPSHQQLLGKIADQIAGAIYAAYQHEREEEKKRQDEAAKQLRAVLPRLIEESEEGFWHAVLTTITHREGNSFNRALLFLQSPVADSLWMGRMAIGHWTRKEARGSWEKDRDGKKSLQDYFAAPHLALSDPTPLQQAVVEWRLSSEQVDILRSPARRTMASSALENALPESSLPHPSDLLDKATDYDCALLPVKQGGKVIGVLWVDNAFDGEPLRHGDLSKVEELLAQAMTEWQQAQERNRSRLLGEKYENILALNRRITERAAQRPLKESLQDLCDQSADSIMSANSIVIYPYLAETGAYDLNNVVHRGLNHGDDFISKNKPRQQGVTFSVLQSGNLVVADVDHSTLKFGGKRLAEHSFVKREGVKAMIAVPMRKALTAEPLGVIYFDYRTPRSFTEEDIARSEHLATIGATVISYAREFGQEQHGRVQAEHGMERQRLSMQLIANIQAQALASDVDEKKLRRSILSNTADLFDHRVKTTLAIAHWEGEGEQRKQMRRDYHLTPKGELRSLSSEIHAGAIGQVLEQNKPLHRNKNDLIVLLRTGEKAIGALAVRQSDKKASFSTLDEESLQRLGRACELALDSVRTRSDLQTMAQTIATVSASMDLATTLDAIVAYARKVAPELDCITMWYTDAEDKDKLISGPQWNVQNEKHRGSRTSDHLVKTVMERPNPLFASVIENGSVLDGDFTREEGIFSTAALSLRFGTKSAAIGALFLNYRKRHEFLATERALFTAFADAAATAIHNAQTLELAQQRQQRFETALRVATAAGASLDLDTVLRGVLNVLKEEFSRKDPTATPYIMLYEDREDVLELPKVAREFYQPTIPEYQHRVRLPLDGEGITCEVARRSLNEKKIIIENVKNVHDEKYKGIYVEVNSNTQSELCAGLLGSNDKLIGVLVIKSDTPNAFGEDDERLFEMAAKQVALALDRLGHAALAQSRVSVAGAMAWAADIAHDINSEVGYIRNRAGWLQTDTRATADQKVDWAKEIDGRAGQLADTVRDAHIERNDPVGFFLKEFLEPRVRHWRITNASDVKITFADDEDHVVYAYKEQTWRAVRHLLRNAAEALATTLVKQITLRVHRLSSEQVELQIQDNGPGLDFEARRHLLRGPFSTKKNDDTQQNSGFGLLIAQSLIETMNGRIHLYPAVEGQGALFAIRLPSKPSNSGAKS